MKKESEIIQNGTLFQTGTTKEKSSKYCRIVSVSDVCQEMQLSVTISDSDRPRDIDTECRMVVAVD
jgi:hypothetical protein